MKVNLSAWDAILQASFIVQLTLLVLVGLSIFCWGVAFLKFRQFKDLRTSNDHFLTMFWKATSLDALYEDFDMFRKSSLARVFKSGYLEMQKLAGQNKNQGNQLQLSGSDNVERQLRKAMDLEVSLMESKLTLLATTGSTGPFIGLFGTVWGIMTSFHKIGQTGSASLAVVAPGISEALVATAIGLAAAIPAVVLYNHFVAQIRLQEIALNNFSSDFLNIIKRNFFRE
ncbi:MAG: protein TolQ [Bdellovibrio sp. CG10_big_fil_rev_8_21_14_0_10_47_8]|nr:MAG: protein TolQ [Bdellovibrio sp. CG10_big_fil_rev_8_21_14_0_10_47_8]